MPRMLALTFAAPAPVIHVPAPIFAQALKPIEPDPARLADGKGAQVFDRTLAVRMEGDRAVARLDAKAGDELKKTVGRTAEQMVQGDGLKAYKARLSLLSFLSPDTFVPRVVTALQAGRLE